MIALLLTIFIGTIYPIFLEIFTGDQISVGPPYFNLTATLIMIPAILVMSFAPMIKWKKDDFFGLLSRLKTIFFFKFISNFHFLLYKFSRANYRSSWNFLSSMAFFWNII